MEEAAEKTLGRFLESEIKSETSGDFSASVRRLCDSLPGLLELWHKATSDGALIALSRCTLDRHSWISTPVTSYSFSLRVSTQRPESLKWTTRVYGYGKMLMHHFGISSPQKDIMPYIVRWPRRSQCDYVFQLLERARTISDVSLSSSMLSNLMWVHTITERATGGCLMLLVHGLDINSGHRSVAGTLLSLEGDQIAT